VTPSGPDRARRPVPRSPCPLCTRPRRNGTRPGAPRFGPRWGQEPKAVAIARASADLPHRHPAENREERESGAGPQRPDNGTQNEEEDDECQPCSRTFHRRLPRLAARPTCSASIIAHDPERRHHCRVAAPGYRQRHKPGRGPRWVSTGGRPGPIGGSGSRSPCWACRPPVPRSRSR